ncbi:MAG: SpoVA/SpoVAEb family sporulation membrane protein [Christensenellaceae bacterium]|jgi:stage V sporulation protein AE|nr:SpoVA/SpoVAEb family sporulation membrane protein [Christensenellaceae bacterium]
MILVYLRVFVIGGIICLSGQLLINTTKLTTAKILVMFLLIGAFLEVIGLYKYLVAFGQTGATVPITGFGSLLARGAINGAQNNGLIGALSGGLESIALCLSTVIFLGFIAGLISKSKTKK